MSNFHFALRFLRASNTNSTRSEEARSDENTQSSNAQRPTSMEPECVSPLTVASDIAAGGSGLSETVSPLGENGNKLEERVVPESYNMTESISSHGG
ncbi:unnamed protein product [Trichobilharzia szidati]|nr:unnamed protein product [Trichobilharzia szidati]